MIVEVEAQERSAAGRELPERRGWKWGSLAHFTWREG